MWDRTFAALNSSWRHFILDLRWKRHNGIHLLFIPSMYLPFGRALVGAYYHSCSPPFAAFMEEGHASVSITTSHKEADSKSLAMDPYLELEEEIAKNIKHVLSKVPMGATEDEILQSLLRIQTSSCVCPSNHLVDRLLKGCDSDWKSALAIFRWAGLQPGHEHKSETYNKMVDILGKMKQIERMWKLVEEMHKSGLITLKTVAMIMRRLSGAGRYEEAIQTFDNLEVMGLKKDVESMNILLDTLCKERRVERAREIFIELRKHILPNAHTFTIFIHGWCKANRIDEAHWTVLEMKGQGFRPCVIAYSTLIQAYCNKFNFRKVYELLNEMEVGGSPPNVVTFTSIMHSLAKSQEINEVVKILKRMKAVRCKPDTLFYNSLIHIFGSAGKLSEASHVFEVEMHMNGVVPNLSTYNTMIRVFCHHSLEQDAFDILKEMETSLFCEPDLLTFQPLLKLCFRKGYIEKLNSLLGDMKNKHHLCLDLATYTLLIHGFCRAGKCEWAYYQFEEMISREIKPRYKTCRFLLEEVEKKYMSDAIESVTTFMKQMKVASN